MGIFLLSGVTNVNEDREIVFMKSHGRVTGFDLTFQTFVLSLSPKQTVSKGFGVICYI